MRWLLTIDETGRLSSRPFEPGSGGLWSRAQAAARRIVFSSSNRLQFLQTFRST
jgi:hypothetical protein